MNYGTQNIAQWRRVRKMANAIVGGIEREELRTYREVLTALKELADVCQQMESAAADKLRKEVKP